MPIQRIQVAQVVLVEVFDGQILIFSAFLKPFSFQMDDPLIPNQVSSNW